MKILNPISIIRDLGFKPVVQNILYRLGLYSGYYRLTTPRRPYPDRAEYEKIGTMTPGVIDGMLSATQPDRSGRRRIIAAADELITGSIRLYGAIPIALNLGQRWDHHWCSYEMGAIELEQRDIKDIWEPARFSWAITLAQAYHLTGAEKYPAFFWEQLEVFMEANPPNLGPQWMNGQEIALRAIALTFAWQAFVSSPHSTNQRTSNLKAALAAHARRISKTMIYASSQRNNHLLSEAAGLYTIGYFLEGAHGATRWRQAGWRVFNQALMDQLSPDGSYIQQSTNYHRLMLHLSIWIELLSSRLENPGLTLDLLRRLRNATSWLEDLCSPEHGAVPNLGANDGANILPLGTPDHLDFRPVIKLSHYAFPPSRAIKPVVIKADPEQVIVIRDGQQCAYLRAARYRGRPSHADQLHLDLWWRDWNIALDPGSFRYAYPQPWDNSLARTIVHNTLTLNEHDQMIRAGRFLWLKPAGIIRLDITRSRGRRIRAVTATHNGYVKQGAVHQRMVETKPGGNPGWLVTDELLPSHEKQPDQQYTARLTWLMPDWDWTMENGLFRLHTPKGIIQIQLAVEGSLIKPIKMNVYRGGLSMTSSRQTDPTWGWQSSHYGAKEPAVALHLIARGNLPMKFTSRWSLPQ